MKRLLLTSLLAAPLMFTAPATGFAGDEGWAALGGFVGGLVLGNANTHQHRVTHHRSVVVRHRPVVSYSQPVSYRYEQVKRKRWVEGYYTHRRLPCGTLLKEWRPGYYEVYYETVRIPVHYGRETYRSYSTYRGGCRY